MRRCIYKASIESEVRCVLLGYSARHERTMYALDFTSEIAYVNTMTLINTLPTDGTGVQLSLREHLKKCSGFVTTVV